ncbi:MAG: hypothetical protein U5L11_17805 [Arhodomonas sp.]|nr:hypothetical protein [Arhodomonas sp.]
MPNEDKLFAMNWNDVKFFVALARHGRLTRAGEGARHHPRHRWPTASPPWRRPWSCSWCVRAAGASSSPRPARSSSVTPRELERQLILGLEGSERDVRVRPKVRVGVTEGLGDNYLSPRIAAWMRGHALDVDFISLPKSTSVTSREADISITLEQPQGEYVIRRVLTEYLLGIYASRRYLDAHGPITSRGGAGDAPVGSATSRPCSSPRS